MPKWINKLPEKVKGPVTSMLEAQIKGLKTVIMLHLFRTQIKFL